MIAHLRRRAIPDSFRNFVLVILTSLITIYKRKTWFGTESIIRLHKNVWFWTFVWGYRHSTYPILSLPNVQYLPVNGFQVFHLPVLYSKCARTLTMRSGHAGAAFHSDSRTRN